MRRSRGRVPAGGLDTAAAFAALRTPLRCSQLARASRNSLHSLRSFRSNNLGESDEQSALARAATRPGLAGRVGPCGPDRSPGTTCPLDCSCPGSPSRHRIYRPPPGTRPPRCVSSWRLSTSSSVRLASVVGGQALARMAGAEQRSDPRRHRDARERGATASMSSSRAHWRAAQRARPAIARARGGAALGARAAQRNFGPQGRGAAG